MVNSTAYDCALEDVRHTHLENIQGSGAVSTDIDTTWVTWKRNDDNGEISCCINLVC